MATAETPRKSDAAPPITDTERQTASGKVLWHFTMSLDGFVAGPGHSMDWMAGVASRPGLVENSVLMLSVTFPVAVGVLLALAAPSARRELLRRAGRCFGAIVAAVAVFPAAVLSGFVDGRFATSPAMAVVTYGVTILTFLWVVPFIFWGIGLALVHVFRTADIHETVLPLLAMTLVWEMTLVDLFTGAYAGVPGPLRVLLMLGAPVSVTAVGLWELHRLRVHYGIAVRDMLMRQPG
ncbi:hypothetical protein ACFVZD_13480 [Streptomyces sp. NPDC058287]|uniref:hypothetical protein n=1 Tax=unclassified Streptomyces TaxID=2593676 RepID=UPI0036EFA4A3